MKDIVISIIAFISVWKVGVTMVIGPLIDWIWKPEIFISEICNGVIMLLWSVISMVFAKKIKDWVLER